MGCYSFKNNKLPIKPDEKMQEVIDKLNLSTKELKSLRAKFAEYDVDNSGAIQIGEFFSMMEEEKNIFSESIFELIDIDESGVMDFSEFVQMVGTYCVFGIEEILKFCFFIFDKDKNGLIEMDELNALIDILHQSEKTSNMKKSIKQLDKDGDGKIDYQEFQMLNKSFPQLLYPAFRIQERMMRYTMGEEWWKRRRADLEEGRVKKRAESEELRKKEFAKLMKRRKTKIMRKMGCLKFYLCCPERKRRFQKMEEEAQEEKDKEIRRTEKRRKARIDATEAREAEARRKKREIEKKEIEKCDGPPPPTRTERRNRSADRREKRKHR